VSWREESKKGFVLLLWTVAARDKAHGAVAACVARGGGVVGGQSCRREVVNGDHATAAPTHAWVGTRGYGPTWATSKRALPQFFF
jgi:hypothetical protein